MILWYFLEYVEYKNYKKEIKDKDKFKSEIKKKKIFKYTMATEERIDIKNREGLDYLSTIPENSIDLVITDPPYIISRETPITTRWNIMKNIRLSL